MEPASAAMDSSSKAPEPIQVLFVEDEFLIREWVAQALTEEGFAVKKASNAVEALRQIACGPVDILLTDINLPGGMDGTALARRMRELNPDLPIIYASARATLLEQGAGCRDRWYWRSPTIRPPWRACCSLRCPRRNALDRRLRLRLRHRPWLWSLLKKGYSGKPPRARKSSSQWMWYCPSMTSFSRASARNKGSVVSIPSTTNSSKARFNRIRHSLRVLPRTISLPTSES